MFNNLVHRRRLISTHDLFLPEGADASTTSQRATLQKCPQRLNLIRVMVVHAIQLMGNSQDWTPVREMRG